MKYLMILLLCFCCLNSNNFAQAAKIINDKANQRIGLIDKNWKSFKYYGNIWGEKTVFYALNGMLSITTKEKEPSFITYECYLLTNDEIGKNLALYRKNDISVQETSGGDIYYNLNNVQMKNIKFKRIDSHNQKFPYVYELDLDLEQFWTIVHYASQENTNLVFTYTFINDRNDPTILVEFPTKHYYQSQNTKIYREFEKKVQNARK